jgi:hypothetical protein
MNKLPKVIYVDESSDEPIFFTSAEECARSGETVTLGVYKLSTKVEVSTQMKQEIVVKKPPKKVIAKPAPEPELERNPIMNELRVMD